jgi:molecular chaperone IbpA
MTSRKLVPAIFDRTAFEPLMKNSIGFDSMFDRLFDDFLPAVNSVQYPPYNIRRNSDHESVIEMALAGYSEGDLEMTLEDNSILVIRGGKVSDIDDNSDNYVYRGVAARKFERKFALADGAEVTNATLKNGMLYVTVQTLEPEVEEPKRIPIDVG